MNLHVRTSHVIVITIAALALLFGTAAGGAVAGAKWIDGKRIEKNSIPANRLQKATITGKQLKKGTIGGDRIRNRSLGTQALTDDAVEELQPTVEYVERRITTTQHIANPGYKLVPAACPEGTQAVAGYVHGDRTAFYDPGHDYVDTATGQFMVQISSPDNGVETYATVQVMCLR